MILSVSRRTDIPAFYSEWFMKRIKEGFVYVRNPFNPNQVSRVQITPNVVDCIVFWSKNPKPLLKYLPRLDEMGYRYYFQWTVTPYKKDIEPKMVNKEEVLQLVQQLAEKIGKEKIILRYDPILITNVYDEAYHYKAFEKLCKAVASSTDKIIISFVDDYRKNSKNLKKIGVKKLKTEDMKRISKRFVQLAKEKEIAIETCAEQVDLEEIGIKHGHCVDGDLIEKIIGYPIKEKDKKDGNREFCGCMKSIDIGQYDSCIFNCAYCYANVNPQRSYENYLSHDQDSPILFGEVDPQKVTVRKDVKSLKKEQISMSDLINSNKE
ncbi:MAG TPA: hypothetical protein DHN33_04130 [Eubacteriaceae bacterium]|nr:hypothetical protein [Eubacteriaceae bacterium]